MKIRQLNKDNKGIEDHNFPGYQHADAIPKQDHLWDQFVAIQQDMYAFAHDLVKLYPKANKFLDIGSGPTYLSQKLRELNPEFLVVSLDGNYEILTLPWVDSNYHFCLRTDVDYTLVDEKDEIVKFDVITSFEHFEHIQPEKFEVFINNIRKHMHQDSVLYASGASWSYSSEGADRVHCNVKSEATWKKEMEDFGFKEIDKKLFNEQNTAACRGRWSSSAELAYKLK